MKTVMHTFKLVATCWPCWLLAAMLLTALMSSGCAPFQQESDWRWKQMNPEWKPLPGDQRY